MCFLMDLVEMARRLRSLSVCSSGVPGMTLLPPGAVGVLVSSPGSFVHQHGQRALFKDSLRMAHCKVAFVCVCGGGVNVCFFP